MSDAKDEDSGLHPTKHERHSRATEPVSRSWWFSAKGFSITWKGMLGIIVTVGSAFFAGGGLVHESLYGSSGDMTAVVAVNQKSIKEHDKHFSDLDQKLVLLEQQQINDRHESEERYLRTREDLQEIKSSINHLSDHIQTGK